MPVAAIPNGLNEFQTALQGTWTNAALPGQPSDGLGSHADPLSYNVMPLPQDSSKSGYILKNCRVSEVVRFNGDDDDTVAIPTTAPNRGGTDLQVPTALYYEQQVYFAGGGPGVQDTRDSPQPQVVHTENGSWLNLLTGDMLTGPYGPPTPTGSGLDSIVVQNPSQQPADISIAKQMSVPHGNSIIALGSFSSASGAPTIPDATDIEPTPAGLDTAQYTTTLDQDDDYQNPLPSYTANPNLPLQRAINVTKDDQGNDVPPLLDVKKYITWTVTTKKLPSGKGGTFSIPFEVRHADVADYSAAYWLLSTDGTNYDFLAYSQNILLEIPIANSHRIAPPQGDGSTTYTFAHWTTNLVTRQKTAGGQQANVPSSVR